MVSSEVVIPKAVHQEISSWADLAYPHEGVGLLIGRFEGTIKKVVRFAKLTNELLVTEVTGMPTLPVDRQGKGAGKTEFVMKPEEFNRETLSAEKQGMDVVGIVHTHPDHPPRPSAIDAAQPFLAQWSNIIVSVQKGKTKEMKSWFRDTDDLPFEEESIKIL